MTKKLEQGSEQTEIDVAAMGSISESCSACKNIYFLFLIDENPRHRARK
jgi:hypothetical protein